MNLQEWREKRQRGEDATLPSGLIIQLRKVGMLDLAERGEIPATLTPRINELMKGGVASASVSLEQVNEFAELINIVARACVVGPDGLDVTELPYEDRLAIFQWASKAASALQFFRQQDAEPVGVG